MKDLFRAFERRRVESLLVGGQAAVLYGASWFTQDLDLWVLPTADNLGRVLRALADLGAEVYKLTPPLEPRWLRRGHGTHFLLPRSRGPAVYLDLMGQPPRVGSFRSAARRARTMSTPWGTLRVAAIPDLVEMKKTNRASDYEVISRLARIQLSESPGPGRALVAWALANSFRVEDVLQIAEHFPALTVAAAGRIDRLTPLVECLRKGRAPTPRCTERLAGALAREVVRLMECGRKYWTPRLAELRALRAQGKLLPEGLPVRRLLRAP